MSNARPPGSARDLAAGPDPVPEPVPDPVPDPVGAAEFARLIGRLGPFEPAPHLAVAVSGGRDSLALGLLAHDWTAGANGRITGLIVDHGLRRGSAGEAARTYETLGRLGIPAAVLKASGRPRKNLQAWARAARYALMADWCRNAGVLHLLVAHHRDDQAETLLASLTRGAGLQGLAGMAAVRELPACRIVRPLLGMPRDRLTATLEARNVAWIDDPSNRDRRFRRVRLRQRLADSGDGPELAARGLRGRTGATALRSPRRRSARGFGRPGPRADTSRPRCVAAGRAGGCRRCGRRADLLDRRRAGAAPDGAAGADGGLAVRRSAAGPQNDRGVRHRSGRRPGDPGPRDPAAGRRSAPKRRGGPPCPRTRCLCALPGCCAGWTRSHIPLSRVDGPPPGAPVTSLNLRKAWLRE